MPGRGGRNGAAPGARINLSYVSLYSRPETKSRTRTILFARSIDSTDDRVRTDGGNASALAKLRNATLLDGGTTSIGSSWNNLVTKVGVQANTASSNLTSQKALLASSQQQQSSVSGVSLDDEAMNLMKYQQAYQASAKVMQTANTLFDSLLSIAGG